MKLYTSDGFSYEGMSAGVVTALRTELGRTTIYITKTEYDRYIQAHQPIIG